MRRRLQSRGRWAPAGSPRGQCLAGSAGSTSHSCYSLGSAGPPGGGRLPAACMRVGRREVGSGCFDFAAVAAAAAAVAVAAGRSRKRRRQAAAAVVSLLAALPAAADPPAAAAVAAGTTGS